MPNQWEICEALGIPGFETLQIRNDISNPPPTFMFTTAGKAGESVNTGDEVTIKLGGKTALTGYVNVVQNSFDSTRHGIMLQGRSKTQDANDTSIIFKDANNGNFDNQTLQAIGNKLVEKFNFKFKVQGQDPPFEHCQLQPGESAYNAIERLCRMQKKWLLHDENGDLIAVDKPLGDSGGMLEEGKNIRSLRSRNGTAPIRNGARRSVRSTTSRSRIRNANAIARSASSPSALARSRKLKRAARWRRNTAKLSPLMRRSACMAGSPAASPAISGSPVTRSRSSRRWPSFRPMRFGFAR
jgi:prophage tail gpP-like protein